MIYWYVSTTGNDFTGSGTYSNPWATIAHACLEVTTPGDIIHGGSGIFIESSRWNLNPGVSIEGEGVWNTIVKSHYVGGSVNDALVYLVNGTNTGQYISGIDFDGDNLTGRTAITVFDRSNVDIALCRVKDFKLSGIRLTGDNQGNSGNLVHGCEMTNCGGGIDYESYLYIKNQTGFEYYSNTLTQTTRGSGLSRDAIRYEGGNRGVKIHNNILTGLWGGNDWTFLFEAWDNDKTAGVGHGLEISYNTIVGLFDFGSGTNKGSYDYSVWWHHNVSGEDTTHDPSVARTGLEFEEICYDIKINNSIFKNLDRSIYFCRNNTAGDFRRVNIHNNIIRDVPYSYSNVTINGVEHSFGTGIMFAGSYSNAHLEDISIRNNAIIADGGGMGVWIDTRGSVQNVAIQGNIIKGFSEAPYGTIDGGGAWSGLTAEKNILYANGNSNNLLTGGISISGTVVNDGGIKLAIDYSGPLFAVGSFESAVGSPAIDQGIEFEDITSDYNDNTIVTPDIGPFDYGSEAPPDTTTEAPTTTSGSTTTGAPTTTSEFPTTTAEPSATTTTAPTTTEPPDYSNAVLYYGETDPTGDTRLNYNGRFHAKRLYSGGHEVSVVGHTHPVLPFQIIAFANPLDIDCTTYKDWICPSVTDGTVININNATDGDAGMIKLIMDGTGGHTITFGTMFTEKMGEQELKTDANTKNIISWRKNGSDITYTIGVIV